MASIAEMLISGAQQSASTQGEGLAQGAVGYVKGAQLALEREKLQQQAFELEQKKAAHSLEKYGKPLEIIKVAHETKDPVQQRALLEKAIPSMIKALKIDDVYDQDFIDILTKSPQAREGIIGAQIETQNRINKGENPVAVVQDVVTRLKDPLQRTMFLSDGEQIYNTTKFAQEEQNKTNRAYIEAQGQMTRQQQAQDAAPVIDQNKKIRDLHTKYEADGGKASADARIAKLEEVKKLLEDGKVKFGTIAKNIPGAGNLDVLARIDPDAKAAIDTIRSSINVKARTGDPNPTENQINQIYNQAIDPRLSNEKNIEKLTREIETEKQADLNARNQFRQLGLKVTGDKAPPPGAWKETLKKSKPAIDKLKPEQKAAFIEGLSKKLNLSMDEVRKELGM